MALISIFLLTYDLRFGSCFKNTTSETASDECKGWISAKRPNFFEIRPQHPFLFKNTISGPSLVFKNTASATGGKYMGMDGLMPH